MWFEKQIVLCTLVIIHNLEIQVFTGFALMNTWSSAVHEAQPLFPRSTLYNR